MRNLFILFVLLVFTTSTVTAQQTVPVSPIAIKAADFTDAQILDLLLQAEAAGLGIDQAEKLAIAKGMPASEAQAFKDRVTKLKAKQTVAEVADTTAPEKTIVKSTEAKAMQSIVEAGMPVTGSELVAAKTDRAVTIYGQEVFRKSNIKVFERSLDTKAPDNYEIGIGDEIGISVFGISSYNRVSKVNNLGKLELGQNLGSVYLNGIAFDKAKALLKARLSSYFNLNANQVEITLAYSRSITVNIVGEVFKPGSYKIPAINTVFNALIAAEGPNDIGTLRTIQLRRGGKSIRTFDVYAFLQNPGAETDFFLQDNDYIIVGTGGKIVNIGGAVKRPMAYELLPNENLNALVAYAGGARANAYAQSMSLARIQDKNLRLIEINYDSLQSVHQDFALQNGDQLQLKSINEEYENRVEITGAVQFPGFYEMRKGDKISNLLERAGGTKYETLLERAYLVRTLSDLTQQYLPFSLRTVLDNASTSDNVVLQKFDRVLIANKNNFADKFNVSVAGEVKQPGEMTFSTGMTLQDALFQTGGLTPEADLQRIEIVRFNYFSDNYRVGDATESQNLALTVDGRNPANPMNKIVLQPFDRIFVRRTPNLDYNQTMTLAGEVKYPGVYPIIRKDETVVDIIERAGGLTQYAAINAATFTRPSLDEPKVVIFLDKALGQKTSAYNFKLYDGDVLNIPRINEIITISGPALKVFEADSSFSKINSPFVGEKSARFYINEFAGGFGKKANRMKTYVIHANKKINRTKSFLLFNNFPTVELGSTIYVLNRTSKDGSVSKIATDWNKVINELTLKLTGLATLYALIKVL